MRLRPIALVSTALLGLPVPGAVADHLVLDPEKTSISFLLEAVAHDVHGTLDLISGELEFARSGGPAQGQIAIDARSGRTGNDRRDATMHRDVLESERYPRFVFTASQTVGELTGTGTSELRLEGEIAIHGVTKPLVIPARVSVNGRQLSGSATFEIPYVEWGMEDPSQFVLRVAKVVTVTLELSGRITQ